MVAFGFAFGPRNLGNSGGRSSQTYGDSSECGTRMAQLSQQLAMGVEAAKGSPSAPGNPEFTQADAT